MDLSKIYPKRPAAVHKGAYGSVLVVCGSKLYSGSAPLSAGAALHAGADLVTVCAPQRAADIAAANIVDLITFPLKGDYLSTRHLTNIFDIASVRKINSIVLGCGLGRHRLTVSAIYKIIAKLAIPQVLDADALFAISKDPQVVRGRQVVLTPHAGELAILLNISRIGEDFDSKLAAAKQAAITYGAVVILKGNVDIITDGNTTITNNSGTPYMTKGGFGDELAGIVGTLLARGTGLLEAAHVAAYINGRAGEAAARDLGESVLASDSFDYIGRVIMEEVG